MPKINQQYDSNASNAQSDKIRYGAPDGPRKTRRASYDGREPLEYPGHEAVAQFLATPELFRESKSVTALAKQFDVERKTIYCWMKDIDVSRRAEWLSMQNKVAGDLILRREWPAIMEKLLEKAMSADVQAIKLYAELAWPQEKQREKSGLSSRSLAEVLERAEEEHVRNGAIMTATWIRERAERQKAAELNAGEENRGLPESKDKPE